MAFLYVPGLPVRWAPRALGCMHDLALTFSANRPRLPLPVDSLKLGLDGGTRRGIGVALKSEALNLPETTCRLFLGP